MPDVRERMTGMGVTVEYMTPEQLGTREQAYTQTWSRIIRASGFQAQ
jgi:tripartite-type tricarboxylate transporter receptor subunit TctC